MFKRKLRLLSLNTVAAAVFLCSTAYANDNWTQAEACGYPTCCNPDTGVTCGSTTGPFSTAGNQMSIAAGATVTFNLNCTEANGGGHYVVEYAQSSSNTKAVECTSSGLGSPNVALKCTNWDTTGHKVWVSSVTCSTG